MTTSLRPMSSDHGLSAVKNPDFQAGLTRGLARVAMICHNKSLSQQIRRRKL